MYMGEKRKGSMLLLLILLLLVSLITPLIHSERGHVYG